MEKATQSVEAGDTLGVPRFSEEYVSAGASYVALADPCGGLYIGLNRIT
jgi:hypothetical protein